MFVSFSLKPPDPSVTATSLLLYVVAILTKDLVPRGNRFNQSRSIYQHQPHLLVRYSPLPLCHEMVNDAPQGGRPVRLNERPGNVLFDSELRDQRLT